MSDLCTSTQIYTGSVCRPYLAQLQSCLLDQQYPSAITNISNSSSNIHDIYISTEIEQERHERYIVYLQTVGLLTLQSSITTECLQDLFSFICLYLFPLNTCPWGEWSQEVIGPSQQSCVSVRDNVCSDLWRRLASDTTLLPDCELISQAPMDLLGNCKGMDVYFYELCC